MTRDFTRRRFGLSLLAAGTGAAISTPAQAGLVGNLVLSVKKNGSQFHASLRMTLNYAGIIRSNYPLFSLTVPAEGKFVGRRVVLPGGSVEGKIAKTNKGFELRFLANAYSGLGLNKKWTLAEFSGSKSLPIRS